ncbi:uncharacterized protein LOC125946355 [Dermacentor silvarum]|uniref:uncharacterized protein LOC125946355 n=1 Tax=Dermacentor silvarum TaxID=543639 RepID=UPI002100AF56|nr:uncharacterized protein LOC125946355 [Dermacentor silvarum]
MGKGASNAYFKTRKGSAAAITTIMAFAILLMLNAGRFYIHGPFHMLHYLGFAYMLNGAFMILHGLMGDMDPTRMFLVTYYGSGALMFLISGVLSVSNTSAQHLLTMAIGVLGIVEGFIMGVLAIFVKTL